MTSHYRDFDDDLMDVADAAGVTRPESLDLADDSLSEVLTAWSRASLQQNFDTLLDNLPIPLVPVVDHAVCAGEDCARVICACVGGLCAGTTVQACPHHELLCDEHRLECRDCVQDYVDDGGA